MARAVAGQHEQQSGADRVVALDHGVTIAAGTFAAVAPAPKVVEADLGTTEMERK